MPAEYSAGTLLKEKKTEWCESVPQALEHCIYIHVCLYFTLYVFLIMCGSKVINNLVGTYRVVRVRLLHRANAFVWTAQTRFVERANAFW